jgi:glucosamine--fructose-6-phosphate aminotransferase (isomerizing)
LSVADEIREQPAVLARLLADRDGRAHAIAERIREAAPAFVFLAARGSSDHAGLYAKYLWGSANKLPVALATPSLFTLYEAPPALHAALVVGVSQSGQSPDIVEVVAEGRRQGALTLAITNDPASPLAQAAELTLDTATGPEVAVAATKTFTAQLAAIALLSVRISGSPERAAELEALPDRVAAALALDDAVRAAAEGAVAATAKGGAALDQAVVLGRGFQFATAFEWSLKVKEPAGVHAEPYSTADFQHGPVAIVERGFPLFGVATAGLALPDVRATLGRLVEESGAELTLISDDAESLALAAHPIALPGGAPEWLAPIVAAGPLQLHACHLARALGRDPDRPRGLSKVTRTF